MIKINKLSKLMQLSILLVSSSMVSGSMAMEEPLQNLGANFSNAVRTHLQKEDTEKIKLFTYEQVPTAEKFVRLAIEMILESLRLQEMSKVKKVNATTALTAGHEMFAELILENAVNVAKEEKIPDSLSLSSEEEVQPVNQNRLSSQPRINQNDDAFNIIMDTDNWKTAMLLISEWRGLNDDQKKSLDGDIKNILEGEDKTFYEQIYDGNKGNWDKIYELMNELLPKENNKYVLHEPKFEKQKIEQPKFEIVEREEKLPKKHQSNKESIYLNNPRQFLNDIKSDLENHKFLEEAYKGLALNVINYLCAIEIEEPFSVLNLKKSLYTGDYYSKNYLTYSEDMYKGSYEYGSLYYDKSIVLEKILKRYDCNSLTWFDTKDSPENRLKDFNGDINRLSYYYKNFYHELYATLVKAYETAKGIEGLLSHFFDNAFPHESHCTASLATTPMVWLQQIQAFIPLMKNPNAKPEDYIKEKCKIFASQDNEFIGSTIDQLVQIWLYPKAIKIAEDKWCMEDFTFLNYIEYYNKGSKGENAILKVIKDNAKTYYATPEKFAIEVNALISEYMKSEAVIRYNDNINNTYNSTYDVYKESPPHEYGKWHRYRTTDGDLKVYFKIVEFKIPKNYFEEKKTINENDILEVRVYKKKEFSEYEPLEYFLKTEYTKITGIN